MNLAPPFLHIATREPAEADGVVGRLRGREMRTKAALFDEFAAALQFPDYFGRNWDALDECLNDLSWLPGRAYLLLVSDALAVLSEERPEAFATLVAVLQRAGEEWAHRKLEGNPWDRPPTPFHVILRCEDDEREALVERLRKAGADFD
jgi:RNAse (barnase) inhibitor barstar